MVSDRKQPVSAILGSLPEAEEANSLAEASLRKRSDICASFIKCYFSIYNCFILRWLARQPKPGSSYCEAKISDYITYDKRFFVANIIIQTIANV